MPSPAPTADAADGDGEDVVENVRETSRSAASTDGQQEAAPAPASSAAGAGAAAGGRADMLKLAASTVRSSLDDRTDDGVLFVSQI